MSAKFNENRLAQILLAPVISEKATSVAEKHNQVMFKVLRDATKPEIKEIGRASCRERVS
jgi:large subunit ribosomal protein L23